jgi:protein involved in polysaccharide export with SLBB domain
MAGNLPEEDNEYILQVGDVIDIKFFYNPELNERVLIRPDGRISLQLIDEVKAAGLAPSELDDILTEKYSATFVKPEITVIVREFSGQKVYVGGEVKAPGEMTLMGDLTALQAIFHAGGFKETAYPGSVIVISKGPDDMPVARQMNLEVDSNERLKLPEDIHLRPFDIVFVPKSNIAKVNKFVDQYINKIVPDFINVGFSYIYGRQKTDQSGTVTTIPVVP